ncbi:hypothetical protein ACH4EC_31355 [Streptomyces anulatus]
MEVEPPVPAAQLVLALLGVRQNASLRQAEGGCCAPLTKCGSPAESVEDASRRDDRLFAHYGQGDGWTEMLDNGFGSAQAGDPEQQRTAGGTCR